MNKEIFTCVIRHGYNELYTMEFKKINMYHKQNTFQVNKKQKKNCYSVILMASLNTSKTKS